MKTPDIKEAVASEVAMYIAPEIVRQQKYVLIPEVVRIVFDHQGKLGINIFPLVKDHQEQHDRKYNFTKMLCALYGRYDNPFASVHDIVTDLMAEAGQQGLTIAIVK